MKQLRIAVKYNYLLILVGSTFLFSSGDAFSPSSLVKPVLAVASVKKASVAASVAIISGYHFQLSQREKQGSPSWRTEQADTRQAWSEHVRSTETWLYAVQTLRNAITANTFLATTVLSLLTVFVGKLWDLIQTGRYGTRRRLLILQLTVTAVSMLKSAYEFLQSARLMTHAGFMFPVVVKSRTPTKVDNIMRKSQLSQWSGLRWLYMSLSPIVWTIGGEFACLASSIVLVTFFRCIDRVPEGTTASNTNTITSNQ